MMNDDSEYTAEYGPEEFERWWLEGRDRDDRVTDDDRAELVEACKYLARAEQRRLLQTDDELRGAIDDWADNWNAAID